MVRFLPFILIPILVLSGLGYWRYLANKENPQSPQASTIDQEVPPVEVPKTLPNVGLEDRVRALEDAMTKLSVRPTVAPAISDSRISDLEAANTELKARVSALEKATPVSQSSSSRYPVYIPLGFGGGPWADQGWRTVNDYQASINADNYQGYSNMQLEVIFRLAETSGTGSVRLYNLTDNSVVSSSQVDTTSNTFNSQTSSTFKLTSGQKTYAIQILSTNARDLYIQSARIKVNF